MIPQTVARQGMSHKHSCAVPFVLRCEVSSIASNCNFTCFVVPIYLFVTPAGLSGKELLGDLVIRRSTFFHVDPKSFSGQGALGGSGYDKRFASCPKELSGLERRGESGYYTRFPS